MSATKIDQSTVIKVADTKNVTKHGFIFDQHRGGGGDSLVGRYNNENQWIGGCNSWEGEMPQIP